jgi:hypothetical protein
VHPSSLSDLAFRLYQLHQLTFGVREDFGQPLSKMSLPKAQKSLSNAVFGPLAGQKLHNIWLLVPSAQVKNSFLTPN